jgi:capsular polysaccharide biosynthesis protein
MVFNPEQRAYEDRTPADDLFPAKAVVYTLWKRLWLIALLAILFAGASAGISLQQVPQYQASIMILIGQGNDIVDSPSETVNLQSLVQTMVEAIQSRSIAEGVVTELDLSLPPEAVLANMDVEGIEGTQLFSVSYTDTNPARAQRVANTIGEVFSKRIDRVGAERSRVTAEVWEDAQLPRVPVSPNPMRSGLLGFMLGGILGVGIAFLLQYLNDTWQSAEEVERVSGVPTLGLIPQYKTSKPKVVRERKQNALHDAARSEETGAKEKI